MRQAGVFDDPPSKNPSAIVSPGSHFLPEVQCPLLLFFAILIPSVQFFDESSEVRSQYTDDDDTYMLNSPTTGSDNSPQPGYPKSRERHNDVPTPPITLITPTEGFTVLSLLNSESPSQPPRNSPSISPDFPRPQSFPEHGSNTFVYQQPPGAPILWPLEHEQEAMLLQHYIENVALFVSAIKLLVNTQLTSASSI